MNKTIRLLLMSIPLVIVSVQQSYTQDYNQPLTIQALNRTTTASAISRAMGGVMLIPQNDVSVMFANPAGLQSLEGFQFSIGGFLENKTIEQTQDWYKLDWMPLMDLFMEGMTGDLRDPVIDPAVVPIPTHRDTLPKNSRNPNWSKKNNQFVPASVNAAIPFEISGMKMTAGLGFVEYANVNYYYENRTEFNRNLDYITLPQAEDDPPEAAEWWRDTRSRDGSIYGYGGALSATIAENWMLGVGGLYISGTIEDEETREGYGKLEFFSNDFRYTPDSTLMISQGTSDLSGLELTFSSVYQTENVMLAFSIKPPTKISRDFTTTIDSTQDEGTDDIALPLRGSIGIGINPRPNVLIGIEYHYTPYSLAEYINTNGKETKPWLDCSSFHVGLDYQPVDFISIRLGYQNKSEVFQQHGNPMQGDPISYAVYSAGFGVRLLKSLQLNFGYEYFNIHYEDGWRLHNSVNKDMRSTIFSSISYTIK